MNRKIKIYAVSDAHGCARDLKKALMEAGFHPNSSDHLLVDCGDNFDRGTENLEMYAYLRSVKNKILIKGNHEEILTDALRKGYLDYSDDRNGTSVTVTQFMGGGGTDFYGRITAPESAKRELYDFVNGMYDYFETRDHVFVHGWTAEAVNQSAEWRRSPMKDWQDARWVEWQRIYPSHPKVAGKTVVCGHRAASEGARFDTKRPGLCYTAFYGDGIVVLDGTTYKSGTVNVYVTEDELFSGNSYTKSITEAEYTAIANGNTTVLIMLRDGHALAVKPGDSLKLTCSEKEITATVVGVYDYPDITSMRKSHRPDTYGMPAEKSEIEARLNARLGAENIERLGLTAVRFSLN